MNHPWLGMVNIPAIKMVMTVGWFMIVLPTISSTNQDTGAIIVHVLACHRYLFTKITFQHPGRLGRPRMGWHSNWSMVFQSMDGNYSPSHHQIQIHQDWLDINIYKQELDDITWLKPPIESIDYFSWSQHNDWLRFGEWPRLWCPSWESIQATGGTKHF